MDSVDSQRAARAEFFQGARHNPAGGGKSYRPIELFGRGILCTADPGRAKFLGVAAVSL